MRIHLRTLTHSLRYAWAGLRTVTAQEQNFRIQLGLSLLVIIAMIGFGVRATEAVALILVMMVVLILEILNTVVEYFIDLLKPRLHAYSKIIKDMMAAAVLLAAMGAVAVGLLIFYPYVLEFLQQYAIV